MKKKILSLMLILSLISVALIMTGCGENSENESNSSSEEQVEEKVEEAVTGTGEDVNASDISAMDDKSEIYGATVTNYTCDNDEAVESWRILYSDGTNIYLLASNLIDIDYVPNGKNGTEPTCSSESNRTSIKISDMWQDYEGIENITNEKLLALNSSVDTSKDNELVNGTRAKLTAYMMDTDAWSGFAGDNAEFAIGGMTVELLYNSYNEKNGTDYEWQITDGAYGLNSSVVLSDNDGLYTTVDGGYGTDIYFASPSYYAMKLVILHKEIHDEEAVAGFLSSDYAGIMPVVCLNEDVELELQSDGTYVIK